MSTLTPPTLRDGNRWRNLRVGLLGGSFNPAHQGHTHIARLALARFNLDFVWWIVTPQNPLKDEKGTAPYNERYKSVEKITASHPRMMATHLERDLGTRYTYETVKKLKQAFPATDFLWICGMDNAHIFHRWDKWRELTQEIPIAFIARPPAGTLVKNCPIRLFALQKAPQTTFLQGTKMLDISSSQIRKNNLKSKD